MENSFLCGIDEAGRGPVIGPMYLAGVRFRSQETLKELQLDDSKSYGSGIRAQRQRASLAQEIMARAEFRIVEISAARIDAFVLRKGGLNLLEQMTAAMILRLLGPSIPVAADGETLFSPLKKEFPSLVAANKADSLFPAVSAASILAKNARDQWFHQYQTRMLSAFGMEVSGGGYVNPRTDSFIEAFQKTYESPPPHMRVSWKRKSKTMDLLFD